jgi:hypothetical protein
LRKPKPRKIPLGLEPEMVIYPLVPLEDEERRPLSEGGGGSLSRFLKRMPAQKVHDEYVPEFQKVAEKLFFKGGRLSDFGLVPKEGIDEMVAVEVLDAMFRSPFPNHIQKEGTIALAIFNWYEPGERDSKLEPEFPVYFRRPGQQEVGVEVLVGKNRN